MGIGSALLLLFCIGLAVMVFAVIFESSYDDDDYTDDDDFFGEQFYNDDN